MRKSETEAIDFDSSAVILECLSYIPSSNSECIVRVLEMLAQRFETEGDAILESIYSDSLIKMIRFLVSSQEEQNRSQSLDVILSRLINYIKKGVLNK